MASHPGWRRKGPLWLSEQRGSAVVTPVQRPRQLATGGMQRYLRFAPGTYRLAEGLLHVLPAGEPAQFLRFDLAGNRPQLTTLLGGEVMKPRRSPRADRRAARQKRHTKVVVDLGQAERTQYVLWPTDGRPIEICAGFRWVTPALVRLDNYYERRDGGEKTINRFVYRNAPAYWNADTCLDRFDLVVGIDTNTKERGDGMWASATATARYEPAGETAPGVRTFSLTPLLGIFTRERAEKPEMTAWSEIVQRLLPAVQDGTLRRVGLVVDSELDALEEINCGQRELAGLGRLPPQFEFIFATASAGTDEFAVNRAIRLCDEWADDVFEEGSRAASQ